MNHPKEADGRRHKNAVDVRHLVATVCDRMLENGIVVTREGLAKESLIDWPGAAAIPREAVAAVASAVDGLFAEAQGRERNQTPVEHAREASALGELPALLRREGVTTLGELLQREGIAAKGKAGLAEFFNRKAAR